MIQNEHNGANTRGYARCFKFQCAACDGIGPCHVLGAHTPDSPHSHCRPDTHWHCATCAHGKSESGEERERAAQQGHGGMHQPPVF